jgi:hypothetical protein
MWTQAYLGGIFGMSHACVHKQKLNYHAYIYVQQQSVSTPIFTNMWTCMQAVDLLLMWVMNLSRVPLMILIVGHYDPL